LKKPSLLVIRDLALAAKLAYEDPALVSYVSKTWNMVSTSYDYKELQAVILHDDFNVILSFRGTEMLSFKDWSSDVKAQKVAMRRQNSGGADQPDESTSGPDKKVHFGFYDSLGLSESYEGIKPYLVFLGALQQLQDANPQRKIWITGHSLGAALASLFAAQLLLDGDDLLHYLGGIYTFGQPRCGDEEFAKSMEVFEKKELVFRIVNQDDVVCDIPPKIMYYAHHGNEVKISDPLLHTKRLALPCKGEILECKPTSGHKIEFNINTKKIVSILLPDMLDDHFPAEYVRSIELFI